MAFFIAFIVTLLVPKSMLILRERNGTNSQSPRTQTIFIWVEINCYSTASRVTQNIIVIVLRNLELVRSIFKSKVLSRYGDVRQEGAHRVHKPVNPVRTDPQDTFIKISGVRSNLRIRQCQFRTLTAEATVDIRLLDIKCTVSKVLLVMPSAALNYLVYRIIV